MVRDDLENTAYISFLDREETMIYFSIDIRRKLERKKKPPSKTIFIPSKIKEG
ncbi:hypothetical protein OXIME_000243 [Oxyplasma meridianum]|uniref:Uncharacterized protein n=1 Tax=Oxyplasma meridianum TaxID=3073602 RepID=A0AAX4NER0_9ARCH